MLWCCRPCRDAHETAARRVDLRENARFRRKNAWFSFETTHALSEQAILLQEV